MSDLGITDEAMKKAVDAATGVYGGPSGRMRAALEAALPLLAPASGRWWICTDWLHPDDETCAPGVKIAGPFRDQNEALGNRARIEAYTAGRTFFVDEEIGQD